MVAAGDNLVQSWPACRRGPPSWRRCGMPRWTATPAPPTAHPSPCKCATPSILFTASHMEEDQTEYSRHLLLDRWLDSTSSTSSERKENPLADICHFIIIEQVVSLAIIWSCGCDAVKPGTRADLTWSEPVPKLSSPQSEHRPSSMRFPKNFQPVGTS